MGALNEGARGVHHRIRSLINCIDGTCKEQRYLGYLLKQKRAAKSLGAAKPDETKLQRTPKQ
jgi:hypothetical protein